ncbi:hypothetical protein CTI12_AA155960 [Artemisia annua]|uniref:Uncharacterized protein n=1 Tax=Artemisia annua TaxID=35608 RepID=A0A2U1PGG3_ARTAN|nr:hypothetical protein CTI12_AA155960 [Artemisia annua]
MINIEDDDGIGDLPPILIACTKENAYLHFDFEVRRSKRVSDQMGKNDGPAVATIDLTSDQEMDDVSGTGFDGGNRRTRTKSVPFKKRPVGSLEGDVFLPSVVGDQQEVVEGSVANKGNRMRSKFFIVSKEQVGKKTAVKRKIYTQQAGGWMFKLNFLVLYFTSIGESNKNTIVNLRFFNCTQDENDILGFDWCSYVLQCLVRTKKSWIRTSHY